MKLLDFLQRWANQKNATIAQISLAWLQAQKPWIVPIPGTSNLEHLKENIKASQLEFSADELKKFKADLAMIKIAGPKNTQQIIDAMGVESAPKS